VGGGVGDESVAVAVAVAVDGEDSDNGKQQKVFWHMSQILASQSRYVDTLLSSPLKKNSNKDDDSSSSLDYKEISLPDIKPSQWERMMTFLTSPSAIRSMSMKDAMELIVPYDEYDFSTGIELCDAVLSAHIRNTKKRDAGRYKESYDLQKLDDLVDIIVLGNEKNMGKTYNIWNELAQQ
jgi:hypothetical protein